jgi:hypothetical protein
MIYPVLQKRFAHPRDRYLKYTDATHKYENTRDPQSKYLSVTTWVPKHFPKFDADAIIGKMFSSSKWKEGHKYWGMTREEIKNQWNKIGRESANAGTALHNRIEEFMNDKRFGFVYTHKELHEIYNADNRLKDPDPQVEWNYFLDFVKDNPELKPYRTEWRVYHEELKIAGSIDMVYENVDGSLSIYDWKRVKDMSQFNDFGTMASHPLISHLHDTKFWHYALQLNAYKYILESKYEKQVSRLVLIQLHPEEATYQEWEVPILTAEIEALFEERKNEL